MNSSRSLVVFSAALAVTTIAVGQGQQNQPRIGYVYPAGGKVGTTFDVVVGGQMLTGVTNVYVSGSGVQATVTDYKRPLTPKQVNELREQLQELQKKRAAAVRNRRGESDGAQSSTNVVWTAEDEKMTGEIREKLEKFGKRPASPAIAEMVTVRVTIAPSAELGEHELRLGAAAGLSNPLMFKVGQLPEFNKQEPKKESQPPGRGPQRNPNEPSATPPTETTISLPAVVNGQILPGGMDRFRFKTIKGQQLVIATSARELIPYLADAVPGWFQAAITLYDAKGNEVAYDDDYRFQPDPVLFYKIPNDGEYVLEIKDALYRGREDFVYRIAVGELPFVTGIFPLGSKLGAKTTVEVRGWNLPSPTLTADITDPEPGTYRLSMRNKGLVSNYTPFAADALPEASDKEPNNIPGKAQPATLPLIVNGRIDPPGDWDVFRFEGRAGDTVIAEVHARRLDSPLDSVLKLTDAAGNQLAFNDDFEDKSTGLNTHHADSYLRAALGTNGAYYIYVGDTQRKGGPAYAYRLRISAPRPDFDLRVVPSSLNARAGASVALTAFALRKDGFTNEIAVTLKDAPEGFKLSGGSIPAGQDQVKLTLSVPRTAPDQPVSLTMEGRATIQGREIVRAAVPAEDMMQAFAYRHLVPSKELKVGIIGRAPPRVSMKLLSATPVRIPAGGTARIRVSVPADTLLGEIRFELGEAPEGITIKSVSPTREGSEILLQSDAGKVKPGQKGNLIVTASLQRATEKGKSGPNQRRTPAATLPAVPFEIVPPGSPL